MSSRTIEIVSSQGWENDIRAADTRHPVDFIEPMDADHEDFPAAGGGALIHETLSWCAEAPGLARKGARIVSALLTYRPDLGNGCFHICNQDDTANSLRGMLRRTDLINESRDSSGLSRAINGCVIVLAWIDQGVMADDKAIRLLVVLRQQKIGEYGGASFEVIAKLKGCSRQHIESLHREFEIIHGGLASA